MNLPNLARSLLYPLGRLQPVLGLGEARPFHEHDFLPAALEIVERPASPAARAVALSIAGFTTIAVAWACLSSVDVVATAPGSILPVGNSKLIQPFETAVIQSIQVTDGQHVQPGQDLIQLNAISALADSDQTGGDLLKAQIEIARLEGLRRFIGGQAPDLVDPPAGAAPDAIGTARASMRAQVAEQQAKLANLDSQIVEKTAEAGEASETIEKLKASLPVAAQQEALRRKLHDEGYGTSFDWLNSREHLIEEQHDLPGAVQHRDEALAAGEALKRQREQTRAEFEKSVLSDLAAAHEKADELIAQHGKAAERVSLLTLKAPIAGTVQQLAVHTIGGVVTPAQTLMVLAPDAGALVVEAHIQNRDIGFVHVGQEAQIKVETFTFTRYGLIRGRVLDISRDAVAEPQSAPKANTDGDPVKNPDGDPPADSAGYVAHVALERNTMMTEGGPVALGPGMKVTVEIRTGRRRVISYLLSPVLRYRQESLRER